jgi:serine acetyltransferase
MLVSDFIKNKNNTKGLIIISCLRLSNIFTRSRLLKILGFPIRFVYKLTIQWIIGCDIPDTTRIGPGCVIFHGQGLVINSAVLIGANCTLRQNTTIGVSRQDGGCPIIGNNVDIGANTVIIGEICVGDFAVIGAGSVITKNIPAYSVCVGNPGRVIKERSFNSL